MASSRQRLPPRSASAPTQADLLRGRGNIQTTRTTFEVPLQKPIGAARIIDTSGQNRLGIDVRRGEVAQRLVVADVDRNPRHRSAVARWNKNEERLARRGELERHRSHAVRPGDRIKAVNDRAGETAMLKELLGSASITKPKELNLAISRDVTDVLKPQQDTGLPPGVLSPPPPEFALRRGGVHPSPGALAIAAAATVEPRPATPPKPSSSPLGRQRRPSAPSLSSPSGAGHGQWGAMPSPLLPPHLRKAHDRQDSTKDGGRTPAGSSPPKPERGYRP